jgi:hypothetical protein
LISGLVVFVPSLVSSMTRTESIAFLYRLWPLCLLGSCLLMGVGLVLRDAWQGWGRARAAKEQELDHNGP